MTRWLGLIVTATAFASFSIVGCAPQDDTKKDTTSSSTTTTDTKTDTTTSNSGTTGTDSTTTTTGTSSSSTSSTVPDMPKNGDDVAVLDTSAGKIVIMFYPTKAPKSVENFLTLAKKGFFDGTRFHRCIPGFMVQGGDPKSKDMSKSAEWGTGGNMEGGKEVNVPDEFNDLHHGRGIVSMANAGGPNTGSSQFFIVVADSGFLDGKYSAFGKVVSGMEAADKIVASGDPNDNGKVDPQKAFTLKSAKVMKWPVK